MTFTGTKLTFADYLAQDDGTGNRYWLIDGALVPVPPESELNDFYANWLQVQLAAFVGLRRVRTHTCEVQVPVLRLTDPANRFPDLVVLREEHLELTRKRLTITREMPPPLLIAEVVSPGRQNQARDYDHKKQQYCQLGIEEYWLIDPSLERIQIWQLQSGQYQLLSESTGSQLLGSDLFPQLKLSAAQFFAAT